VTIDCHDLERVRSFWQELLGYQTIGAGGQYASIGPVEGGVDGPKLIFQIVPEPKVAKNRLHLDVDLDPGQPLEAEVERALALGATRVGAVVEELGQRWQVLQDPEGNELCIVEVPGAEH